MRKLKKEERDLIMFLIKDKPHSSHIIQELPEVFVEEMDDGGMGSLLFFNKERVGRKYGPTMAQIQLRDTDGVPLLISVDLDEDGDIFELDIFKGDFSSLVQFPLPPYNAL